MDHLVSVVIPAHNSGKYIVPALDSILAQKYRPLEILVVDDGSTDSTAQVVSGYAPEVRLIKQEQRGHPAARNAGVAAAAGDFLGFLDHDDLWTPDKLERQIASFRRDPMLDLVFGHIQNFFTPEMTAEERKRLAVPLHPLPGLLQGSMLARHRSFDRVGLFSEERGTGDFLDWYGRALLARMNIEMLPETLVYRRIHASNYQRTHKDQRQYLRAVKDLLDRRRGSFVAVVILAVDGVGLGHLVRSTIVSHALASVGERPVMFTEAKYHPHGLEEFPIRLIPSLWNATEEVRRQVASDLSSMAAISLPMVVIEDTHPNPIHLPSEIRRVLLVRPTSFDYLMRLNQQHGSVYSAYLLCDSPDSPTWPYDETQTRQLAAWKKWHVIGPIYRRPTEDEIREVRRRNHISEDQDVCVFTMGGGGVHVHDKNAQDIVRFLRLALEVADVVQPEGSRVRLLFVKGPYFPPRIPIPSRFEVLPDEEQMPALLTIAKGAVIRAGFNTTWECMAAGTPFIPLIGTTFAEPVRERVNNLKKLGLLPQSAEQFWSGDQWRAEYRRVTQGIVARHSGTPEPIELGRLVLARPPDGSLPKPKVRAIGKGAAKPRIPFVIRIDDVVCKEPALGWLLGLLAGRRLRASLEVVPYLLEFDERFVDHFDPSNKLFEVSQHGYAHVPRTSETGGRCEFSPESAAPTVEEAEMIAKGKRRLEAAFPKRFTGGFSPPFDALPPWLPATWRSLGGTFISNLGANSVPDAPLPVTRAGVDVWDWANDRALSLDWMRRKLAFELALDGYAGIVLHPRCLRSRAGKLRLLSLLNYMGGRAATVSLRDIALGRVERAKRPALDVFR